jgi:hypothetical protein
VGSKGKGEHGGDRTRMSRPQTAELESGSASGRGRRVAADRMSESNFLVCFTSPQGLFFLLLLSPGLLFGVRSFFFLTLLRCGGGPYYRLADFFSCFKERPGNDGKYSGGNCPFLLKEQKKKRPLR